MNNNGDENDVDDMFANPPFSLIPKATFKSISSCWPHCIAELFKLVLVIRCSFMGDDMLCRKDTR